MLYAACHLSAALYGVQRVLAQHAMRATWYAVRRMPRVAVQVGRHVAQSNRVPLTPHERRVHARAWVVCPDGCCM